MRNCVSTVAVAALAAASPSRADEGGVGVWLPGNFGSFVAVPSEPGWTLASIFYHLDSDGGAEEDFPISGRISAGVEGTGDFLFLVPAYVFATPVAGGQAAVSMAGAFGPMDLEVEATLTGPRGNAVSGSQSDSRTVVGDLFPMATLKWNRGTRNYMVYGMAVVPTGAYDPDHLANLSTNHWALDAGGGYTFFDKKNELSAALGFSYNWENPDTDYRNGIDAHLDLAATHFFSPTLHAGLVGYVYHHLTGDSGAGATLGDFESEVMGVGPQLGRFFRVAERTWYANFKGYYEFDAKNRLEGWNLWAIVAIPLSGKQPSSE